MNRPSPLTTRTAASLFALLLTAYFIGLFSYLALHNMMWADEFLAWNLLTDSSWSHMIGSWYQGADSGGLAFYLLNRSILSLTGTSSASSPTVIRIVSGLCFTASAWIWFGILRRRFPTWCAVSAVLLIWFGSFEILSLAVEVRFYGLLLLTFSLAVAALSRSELRPLTPRQTFLLAFLANTALVASHMLGLVYSAELAFVAAVVPSLHKRRIAILSGTALAWLLVLSVSFKAIHQGAAKLNWILAPNLHDTIRFYFNVPFTSRSANLALLLIALAAVVASLLRNRRKPATPHLSSSHLSSPDLAKPHLAEPHVAKPHLAIQHLTAVPLTSCLLLLTPIFLAIVSHLYKPIFADRYLIPYLCGLTWLVCFSLDTIANALADILPGSLRLGRLVPAALAGIVLCATLYLHMEAVHHFWRRPLSSLAGLQQLQTTLPIAIADDNAFFQLQYYDRSDPKRYVLLMDPGVLARPDKSILATLQQRGYARNFVDLDSFLNDHPEFLYAKFSFDHNQYARLIANNRRLTVTPAGSFQFDQQQVPLLLIRRSGDPSRDNSSAQTR